MVKSSDLDRFWAKVDRSGGPDAGQMRQAHRWILGVDRGQPLRWDEEVKEEACHHCDNTSCCNLKHLYVGDRHTNMQDCVSRGRNPQANKTHCPNGHEYTVANTYIHSVSGRQCRLCQRSRVTAQRRNSGVQVRGPKKTCPGGHEYSPENTYISRTGKKFCRTCNRESAQRRRRARDGDCCSVARHPHR